MLIGDGYVFEIFKLQAYTYNNKKYLQSTDIIVIN